MESVDIPQKSTPQDTEPENGEKSHGSSADDDDQGVVCENNTINTMGSLERNHLSTVKETNTEQELKTDSNNESKQDAKEDHIPSDEEEKITSPVNPPTSSDNNPENLKTNEIEKEQSIFSLTLGQTVLLATVICVLAVSQMYGPANAKNSMNTKEDIFFQKMKKIVNMLKSTESNLRFVNKSLTVFMKEDEHKKPPIVLLLGTNSSSCSLCKILQSFVIALSDFYGEDQPTPGEGYIKADHVRSRNSNDGKKYIEENIETAANNSKHVIVMEDLDKFPVTSLSKVHSYLDHENRPHKEMVYILTGVTGEHQDDFQVQKYMELNKIATNHFDDSWSDYDEDHRRALMGRMTSVIGYIHQSKLQYSESTQIDCSHKCEV